MDSRSGLTPGTIDEKNLLANYQAALFGLNGQQPGIAMMAAAAAAAAASGQYNAGPNPNTGSVNQSLQHQQQLSMLNQAQYMANMFQQNDNFNMIQNSLASGVPTLHIPTILSYLGYNNTFQPQNNNNNNGGSSSNGSKNNKNSLDIKYGKLMDVVQEIGRDVRPLYTGSKTASDRLRRQINQARLLVRECLNELDSRSQNN